MNVGKGCGPSPTLFFVRMSFYGGWATMAFKDLILSGLWTRRALGEHRRET
jgi:hypothetical protein